MVHTVDAVIAECAAGGPTSVPSLQKLAWVKIVSIPPPEMGSVLWDLGAGERMTLHAAMLQKADRVLIDEKIGRNLAEYLGLAVTGTLGVVLKARRLGLVPSFSALVRHMRERGIRYNLELARKLAAQVNEHL
ncbi:MAG: DUF3368 domain-containing protein [Deferrisomatales bacterium]